MDLSVGTPCDPPPDAVVEALGTSGAERGYPASIGSAALRGAAADWMRRLFGVSLDPVQVAACVGTKEFVATAAWFLQLRTPDRDTVLAPALAYPTYAMGARLAGCRLVEVPAAADGSLDLSAVADEDAERALCLWVNSPSNPTGALTDLAVGRGVGTGQGRSGALRRVLRGVHVGRRSGQRHPGRHRRRPRRAFAVETLEPGGPARRLLRR